ncbi:hypothetical protein DICVIV_07337 [Dictyocaulus viviparus]|uniref:Uncharacterized protein n=1 Tax=Dictyocaulus viviparus TaxID=29172 RepID=A0A0D8XS17_DICVI|nr:hypothetical protein DICVIV_07337 [Dictyocaulus viviparus]
MQIPMRPHDASPSQIISMQQPTVPPAPEMAMHDRIYQEMQKKSQGMDFNAPSKPIWTAITPTPETPTGNYDHDAIFQENLRKINDQSTTTISSTTEKVAQLKPTEGENMFRDILSVFDDAEKTDKTQTTTENVFKVVNEEKPSSTKIAVTEKETPNQVDDSTVQVNDRNVFYFHVDATTENIFDKIENQKNEAVQVGEGDNEENPIGPIVVEDRFPRIEPRTIMPIEDATVVPIMENDEIIENDPLAAFLRYFEQEAQKINSATAQPAVVDSETLKDEPNQDLPIAVDEPEPHIHEFPPHVPQLVTV